MPHGEYGSVESSSRPKEAQGRDIDLLFLGYIRAYKPGAAARGGYVYGADGKPVREVVWLTQEASKLSRETGQKIKELLTVLRERAAAGK